MLQWLGNHVWWLTGASFCLLVAGFVSGIIAVVRMPADYFLRGKSPEGSPQHRHPILRLTLALFKNVLAAVLVAIGIILSLPLVPGPGLLLILVGLSLASFPGKRKLELRIVRAPWVLRPINRLRAKAGRPPLRIPDRAR